MPGRGAWMRKCRCTRYIRPYTITPDKIPANLNSGEPKLRNPLITDCHIHIQPMEMIKPQALELMKKKRPNFEQIVEFCRSPKAFLKFLDAAGVDRAMLINYVAPEVIGFTSGVNQFVADYVQENPARLLSCGSLHPRHTTNVLADVEQILRLGLKMIKIHPPHQLL